MSEPLSSDPKVDVKPESKSPDDIKDFFSMGDDKPEDKTPPEDKEDKEDKKPVKRAKEDKEDKDDVDEDDIKLKEDEDEDEEKLDLDKKDDEGEIEIDVPPRKREVLAKYPTLFKDFPFFEKLMFRDKQYTELFGSFDDAKEVAERATVLEEFEQDLLKGNTHKVLSSVKDLDKKAFDKIVDTYLPTLAKVDKEAYFEVVGNIGKHMIREMVLEAKNSSNEDLNKAALLLNQFLFGTSTYSPPARRVEKDETKESEVEKERALYTRERFDNARNDLQTRVDNVLKSTISDYIDPKGEMTSYVKKNAVRDALTQLHSTVGQDTAFRRNLDRLWEAAFNDKFSQQSLNRIRSAYLGRSKQSLSTIIKKARAEALKDALPSSRKQDDDEDEERTERTARKRGPVTPGRPHHQSGKMKMEKGESVLDFLSRE